MRKIFLTIILCLIPMGGWAGIDFDGSGDSIDCNNNASLQITGNITVGAWFKSTGGGNDPLVAKWGSDQAYLLLFSSTTANKIRFAIRVADVSKGAQTTNSYNDNVWHLAIGIFDGSNVIINMDNGSEIITGDATTGPIDNPASNELWIGSYNNNTGSSTNSFNGILSEVFIFNRVLSAAEIALIYNSKTKRIPLQLSGCQAYWPLDEGADGNSVDLITVFDMSVNRNDGNPDDGTNNTGLTAKAEEVLSYPWDTIYVHAEAAAGGAGTILNGVECRSVIIY